MLHAPINAYPHNTVVDVNYPISFTFTHSGSKLENCKFSLYSTTSASLVDSFWIRYSESLYNGDQVCAIHKNSTDLHDKVNYKWNVTQYQESYDIFAARSFVQKKDCIQYYYTNQPTSDAFLSGYPQGFDTSLVTDVEQFIPVAYETSGIEAPVYDEDGNLIGGQYLEINGERRLILGIWSSYVIYLMYYNNPTMPHAPYTDAIIVESPFSTFPEYNRNWGKTVKYSIFKNYLTSPFFYFKSRNTPTTALSVDVVSSAAVECTSTYYQSAGIPIQSYNWSLYHTTTDELLLTTTTQSDASIQALIAIGETVDRYHIPLQTGLTFSLKDAVAIINGEYLPCSAYDNLTGILTLDTPVINFPNAGASCAIHKIKEYKLATSDVEYSEKLVSQFPLFPINQTCRCVMTVATQDGMQYASTTSTTLGYNNSTDIIDSVTITPVNANWNDIGSSGFTISWGVSNGLTMFDYAFNVYKQTDDQSPILYAQNIHETNNDMASITDYAVGNEHKYKYHIVPILNSSRKVCGATKTCDEAMLNVNCWSITALHANGTCYNKKVYETGDTWTFRVDVTSSDFTHNTDRKIYTSTSTYPKQIKTKSRYITSGLTCVLGNMDCQSKKFNGSVQKLDQWRQFIFENDIFLLKTIKGDIFIVVINDNPSETYEEVRLDGIVPVQVKFEYTEVESIHNCIVR